MNGEFSPEEFKDGLTQEYSRAKERVRIKLDTMGKKQLKRLVMTLTGVFHNEVELKEDEQEVIEDIKTAMENFMAIAQAEGELPQS